MYVALRVCCTAAPRAGAGDGADIEGTEGAVALGLRGVEAERRGTAMLVKGGDLLGSRSAIVASSKTRVGSAVGRIAYA